MNKHRTRKTRALDKLEQRKDYQQMDVKGKQAAVQKVCGDIDQELETELEQKHRDWMQKMGLAESSSDSDEESDDMEEEEWHGIRSDAGSENEEERKGIESEKEDSGDSRVTELEPRLKRIWTKFERKYQRNIERYTRIGELEGE